MPPGLQSEIPLIPNHELLRPIGRGAYGEIWMARSLTGALRAVKIVDRRRFETERTFQREFEGMCNFEPISRSDAGFVDILHVGRDPEGHFFYYVMELADDASGALVDPEQYEPKTLRSFLRRGARVSVSECLEIGLSLTRTLGVLHDHGLVHRDIKPANVIFAGGVPKVADIGLVAASGQDSFVGTEGYVPPEGPGSISADLYSLGKVLYELAMRKDRLDFPALHSDFTRLPDRATLLRLNEVLLRACAHEPEERYQTAQEFHADLLRVRDGGEVGRRFRGWKLLMSCTAAAVIPAASWLWWQQAHAPGSLTVETEPAGAMVVLDGTMKRSPATFPKLRPGAWEARVMHAGYDPVEIEGEIQAGENAQPAQVRLQRSRGRLSFRSEPAEAEVSVRQDGMEVYRGDARTGGVELPTGAYEAVFAWRGREQRIPVEVRRGETTEAAAEFANGRLQVRSTPPGAAVLLDGAPAGATPLEVNTAEGEHMVTVQMNGWPAQSQSAQVRRGAPGELDFEFRTGRVKLTSAPGAAAVFSPEGAELGRTPLLLEDLPPGPVRYEFRVAGYKPQEVAGEVRPGEQTFLAARFVERSGPRRDAPWENTLGMRFAPVGEVLVGIWPVRIQDYDAFCRAQNRARPVCDFPQEDSHPVVRVNWEDATAFCEWLTTQEIAAGRLEAGQLYRLPTDLEWSKAAGLPDEGGLTPEQRDGKIADFAWGRQWPPPVDFGNFGEIPGARRGHSAVNDAFPQTSPVGSFPPNKHGLHDMSGNVWQWVLDSYKGAGHARDWGVLRGGSWANSKPPELRAAYRNVVDRMERDVIFGFRVVLVPEGDALVGKP